MSPILLMSTSPVFGSGRNALGSGLPRFLSSGSRVGPEQHGVDDVALDRAPPGGDHCPAPRSWPRRSRGPARTCRRPCCWAGRSGQSRRGQAQVEHRDPDAAAQDVGELRRVQRIFWNWASHIFVNSSIEYRRWSAPEPCTSGLFHRWATACPAGSRGDAAHGAAPGGTTRSTAPTARLPALRCSARTPATAS